MHLRHDVIGLGGMKINRYLYLQSLMSSFVVVLVVAAAVASAEFVCFFNNYCHPYWLRL